MADLVESPVVAARLADHVLDPERTCPIICVTVPTWASQPLLDVAALERELPESAVEVCVVPTGDATWELSRRLPTGLDVYGGAVRLWWPGLHEASDERDHPLFFVHSASDTPSVVERLLTALERGGVVSRRGVPVGGEYGAVVTRVLPDGAEFTLVDGTRAYARRSHLSRHDLAPDRVVRLGQAVRVRVGHRVPGKRVMVSLLPFEPDPWRRLTTAYPVGTVVEGVVAKLRNVGAFVEVFPGVMGLLRKSWIVRQGQSHPEEVLTVGQRIVVRIARYDQRVRGDGEATRRIELALAAPEEAPDAHPVSIFPDGPAWLTPAAERDGPPPVVVRGGGRSDRPTPPVPVPRRGAGGEPGPVASSARGDAAVAGSDGGPVDVELLTRTLEQARDVRVHLGGLLDDAERRLAQMRREAAQIRRQLEQEIGEVRRRIMELVESEAAQLLGSTQEALDAARAEAQELREQLTAALHDRHRLLERLQEMTARAERAEHAARQARQELRRERAVERTLRARVRQLDPDEHLSLRNDIHQAWLRTTTPADRQRYPWREPEFGPDFAASLQRVHGIARRRLAEVCADVVCGRAAERPGLELHPLRVGEGGEAPQRVRADGAKAYRVALQVHAPSARRLHYWLLPDSRIEFAKVVYHDDASI